MMFPLFALFALKLDVSDRAARWRAAPQPAYKRSAAAAAAWSA